MIPESIQTLARDAIIATAVQGQRCMTEDGDHCVYTNGVSQHCAVGHALTPEQQKEVGQKLIGVTLLSADYPDIKERLGGADVLSFWSELQCAHDKSEESVHNAVCKQGRPRPFGVSWSRWFWSRARNRCLKYGFDIGGFPKHLMPAVH